MNQIEPTIKPVKQGLYKTLDSLDDVVALGKSMLPISDPNLLIGLLMVYNNTLLKEISAQQ